MAGKRLLDLSALFHASRGVAQKHVALRSRQLDVYNQTSSLARAVRSQTDRITETVKAASILASRLNQEAPSWTSDSSATQSGADETIPSKDSVNGSPGGRAPKDINQDSFYNKSATNTSHDPVSDSDLEVQQETADRYPLPDGTIPPADTDLNEPPLDHEVDSTRSPGGLTNEVLNSGGIAPTSSDRSSIPIPSASTGTRATSTKPQTSSKIPSNTADAYDSSVKGILEEGHGEDSFYEKSTHTSSGVSSLPRVQLPSHTSTSQEGDGHLAGSHLNSDTFYATSVKHNGSPDAVIDEETPPEGINTDLFHSPRVARLLGGRANDTRGNPYASKHAATATPSLIQENNSAISSDSPSELGEQPSQTSSQRPDVDSETSPNTTDNEVDCYTHSKDDGSAIVENQVTSIPNHDKRL